MQVLLGIHDYQLKAYDPAYKITVNYSVNSQKGTADRASDLVYYGQSFMPPSVTPTANYFFKGWDIDNGGGIDVMDGQPAAVNVALPITGNSLTYTAVFEPAYNVTFHSNGGTTITSIKLHANQKISAPTEPKRDGCIFKGWFKESSFQSLWDFDNDYVTSQNTHLYAKWEFPAPNISLEVLGPDSINVKWDAVPYASGYDVFRSDSIDGPYLWIYTSHDESMSYKNTGLTMGNTYYYRIRAYTNSGWVTTYSDYCTPASAIPVLVDIQSSNYTIDRTAGLIKGVADGTTVAMLKSNLDNDSSLLKVYDASGQEITSGNVGTGMTIEYSVGGVQKDSLRLFVLGDTNGDGVISVADYVLIRLDILEKKKLDGIFAAAGDIDMNGTVDVKDYSLIRLDILGIQKIN